MKLAFDETQRGPEGAQKRPFGKLKVAGTLLAASIFTGLAAVGMIRHETAMENRRCESCRHEVDSVSLGRIAAYLEVTLNRKGERIGRDSLVHKALEEYAGEGSYRWYPGFPSGLPWDCRETGDYGRYVGSPSGEDLGNGRRAKDSTMLLGIIADTATLENAAAEVKAAMMRQDSVEIIKAVAYAFWLHIEKQDQHLTAAGWRGAFIHDILNTAELKLPEERKRQADSLLLCPVVAYQVESQNRRVLAAIERDESSETYRFWKDRRGRTHEHSDWYCSEKRYENALKEYEKAKLPDGRSRGQDSIELIRRFVELGHEHDAAYEEHLYENGPHVSSGSPPPAPAWTPPMPHEAGRE